MKTYSFMLVQNTGAITHKVKCHAFGCDTDLSKEKAYYREEIQTELMPAPAFNYFCVRCGEKARRNLKFY